MGLDAVTDVTGAVFAPHLVVLPVAALGAPVAMWAARKPDGKSWRSLASTRWCCWRNGPGWPATVDCFVGMGEQVAIAFVEVQELSAADAPVDVGILLPGTALEAGAVARGELIGFPLGSSDFEGALV